MTNKMFGGYSIESIPEKTAKLSQSFTRPSIANDSESSETERLDSQIYDNHDNFKEIEIEDNCFFRCCYCCKLWGIFINRVFG